MLKYSRHRYSYIILWIFVVASIHSISMRLFAQQSSLDEAMNKWHDYEVFSHCLQGKMHYQSTDMIIGKSTVFPSNYKQNQNCAMICSSFGKVEGGEICQMTNPNYSSEIKISQTNPRDALLLTYEQGTNAVLPAWGWPLDHLLFNQLSPHFSYCRRDKLSDVISRSSFHVEKISKEIISGREFVRVDHNYIYYQDPPSIKNRRQGHVNGSIYLDPSRCWCIKRIKNSEKVLINGKEDSTVENDIQCETIDHSSGFPIIKSQIWDVTGYSQRVKRKFNVRHRYDYEVEVKDSLPDADFTLSAFGLPEPIGVSVNKPIPAYIWILATAGICASLAFVFRFFARRKRPMPSA